MGLMLAMLRRYPVIVSDDDILQWHDRAQRLGWAVWRLGLWPFLLDGASKIVLSTAIGHLANLSKQAREDDFVELCQQFISNRDGYFPPLMFFLFGGELFYQYPEFGFLDGFRSPFINIHLDPVDDLSIWPVPERLCGLVGNRNVETANVFGLMTTVQGTPSVIAREISHNAGSVVEIALFGAAHLIADTEPETLLGGSVYRRTRVGSLPHSPQRRVRISSIAEAAWAWFVEHMPKLVFPKKLEEVIEETAEKSYE
jgi:hypothetical protein